MQDRSICGQVSSVKLNELLNKVEVGRLFNIGDLFNENLGNVGNHSLKAGLQLHVADNSVHRVDTLESHSFFRALGEAHRLEEVSHGGSEGIVVLSKYHVSIVTQ